MSIEKNKLQKFCECGSRREHPNCCGPYLSSKQMAPTPEKLMRSRYSAYCRGNIDYLIRTDHPSRRKPDDVATIGRTIRETEWLGLRVLAADKWTQSELAVLTEGQRATVEYVAFFNQKIQGIHAQMHERSEFVWEDRQWYYVDGLLLPPITLNRNEPCWCGSSKKYKKCHGR